MPRKQNGFGNFGNSGFKGIDSNVKRGKGTTAFGSYPSNRKFGSTVNRTVIEQYNLDSTWARWRRGMEYYFQAAYLDFEEVNSVLFPGTSFEIPITFDGYRFATKNADSKTHYSIKRSVPQSKQLGVITEIQNDQRAYPEQYKNREIWAKVIASRDIDSDAMLLRSEGERITNGNSSATVQRVLTAERKPAVYSGKTPPDATSIRVTIPLDAIANSEFIRNNNGNLQALVGEAVYMPDFYQERPVSLFDVFTDFTDYFSVQAAEFIGGVRLEILDNTTTLPPTLLDIQNLEPIFKTDEAVGSMQSNFIFQKSDYQRFFGQQYLTADVVRDEVQTISYSILPWTIRSILIDEDTNQVSLESEPFQASAKLYVPIASERWIIMSDNSFTYQTTDNDDNGNYLHALGKPGDPLWQKINISVDPWLDEIFADQKIITFADVYTCSCPAYLHALIRAPETYDEEGNQLNRQTRYPMPTAKGTTTYQGAGLNRASGIAESWATPTYKKGFKVCKHTIASMFINKIRVEEPNTFPSYEARVDFEQKLAADIREVVDEFLAQLERSEITTVEIVFALADALNLDEVELGYVLLTSNF
jgi:hypothetical protein